MPEKYIFIIWNSALFCKNRILNDLSDSFVIEKIIPIKWKKENYEDNLKALYGSKAPNTKSKADVLRRDVFYLVIIEDDKPKYEMRKTYNGKENVNSKVYDKKQLYRRWTAGNFRVHCSLTQKETTHDLTVLFGPDFQETIEQYEGEVAFTQDTKGVIGFKNEDELRDALLLFSDAFLFDIDEKLICICSNRIDVNCFLNVENIYDNKNQIKIGSNYKHIYVFGEEDGDIPNGFLNRVLNDQNLIIDFSKNLEEYVLYIKNGVDGDIKIKDFLNRNGFFEYPTKKNAYRKDIKLSAIDKLKNYAKYLIRRVQIFFIKTN